MDPVTQIIVETDDEDILVDENLSANLIAVESGEGQIEETIVINPDETLVNADASNIADTINIPSERGPEGDPGPAGTIWRDGTGPPLDSLGENGDYYLQDETGDVWNKSADVYTIVATIIGPPGADGLPGADGPPGPTGPPGSVWYAGSGVPSSGLGVDGDFYFDYATDEVYQKVSGTWGVIVTLPPAGPQGDVGPVGPEGPEGPQGNSGPQGDPGTRWREGTGAPSNTLGVDGDFYFRIDTDEIYHKESGVYVVIVTLPPVGPQGDPGPQGDIGPQGVPGPTGLTGAPGDGIVTYFWESGEPPVTGIRRRWYADRDGSLLACWAGVALGDGNATAQFDILLNGATIYPSSTKPTVPAGQYIGVDRVPDTLVFSKGDYFEVQVIATGGTLGPLRAYISFQYEGIAVGGSGLGSYSTLIGNGSATSFSVTQAVHGLAANGNLSVDVYEVASNDRVQPDIRVDNTGTVTVTFATAPTTNQYRLLIIG